MTDKHLEQLREIGVAEDEIDPRDGADDSLELHRPAPAEIERIWRTFWLPAITTNRRFDPAKLKAELYDAHHLIMEAPKVYRHVTGGMCDDPCASAEGINAMADKRIGAAFDAGWQALGKVRYMRENEHRPESEIHAAAQRMREITLTEQDLVQLERLAKGWFPS